MILATLLATGFCRPIHANELVRVRIMQAKSSVSIQGLGLEVKGLSPAVRNIALAPMGKIEITRLKGRPFFPQWSIHLEGAERPQRLSGQTVHIEGQSLRLGLEPIPPTIELIANSSGGIDVVSELDIEKYLLGVLPAEMPGGWPEQALMAQAVASRSYTLRLLKERKRQHFQLEATVFDQVFAMGKQAAASRVTQIKVLRAIKSTAGQILVDDHGEAIKAFYHADCGGATETARNVWGERVPEAGTTVDNSCPIGPLARWNYEIDRQLLRKKLIPFFGLPLYASLEAVTVSGRTASGRVDQMDVVFSGFPLQHMSSHEFRKLIGFDNLKSTNFNLRWGNELLEIRGKGHGHGVGLCQYGARQMAANGADYLTILHHYYPKANLNTVRALRAKGRVL